MIYCPFSLTGLETDFVAWQAELLSICPAITVGKLYSSLVQASVPLLKWRRQDCYPPSIQTAVLNVLKGIPLPEPEQPVKRTNICNIC